MAGGGGCVLETSFSCTCFSHLLFVCVFVVVVAAHQTGRVFFSVVFVVVFLHLLLLIYSSLALPLSRCLLLLLSLSFAFGFGFGCVPLAYVYLEYVLEDLSYFRFIFCL